MNIANHSELNFNYLGLVMLRTALFKEMTKIVISELAPRVGKTNSEKQCEYGEFIIIFENMSLFTSIKCNRQSLIYIDIIIQ